MSVSSKIPRLNPTWPNGDARTPKTGWPNRHKSVLLGFDHEGVQVHEQAVRTRVLFTGHANLKRVDAGLEPIELAGCLPMGGAGILIDADFGAAVYRHLSNSPIDGLRKHIRDPAACEGDAERCSRAVGIGQRRAGCLRELEIGTPGARVSYTRIEVIVMSW